MVADLERLAVVGLHWGLVDRECYDRDSNAELMADYIVHQSRNCLFRIHHLVLKVLAGKHMS